MRMLRQVVQTAGPCITRFHSARIRRRAMPHEPVKPATFNPPPTPRQGEDFRADQVQPAGRRGGLEPERRRDVGEWVSLPGAPMAELIFRCPYSNRPIASGIN